MTTARSLADDLRARTDDELVALVQSRPDLARPAPVDVPALAARASTRTSVQRAIERLDRGLWSTLQAAVVDAQANRTGEQVGPVRPDAVARLLGAPATAAFEDAVDRLWQLALLWRSERGLELARAVPEVVGPHPGGLPRPTPVPTGGSEPGESTVDRRLAQASAAALAVADRLAWDGPTGQLPGPGPALDGAIWLVEQGLATRSGDHLTLTRPAALARRDGRLHRSVQLRAPDLPLTDHGAAVVDRLAGAAARDLLDHVDELAQAWADESPRVLRAGGVSVRDVGHLAQHLGLSAEHTVWLLELEYAARLVADDGGLAPAYTLTTEFDAWQGRDPGTRWAELATAWLTNPRAAHRSAGRNALAPDGLWPAIRGLRADLLALLADLPRGHGAGAADLVEQLHWRHPLRDRSALAASVEALLQEADWLAVTALGALSTPGLGLADRSGSSEMAHRAAAILPAPVDHILLQADLTAVAPGPLDGALGRFVRLVSDIESRGGATVSRFTPESVRRALDAGWSAEDVLEMLRAASRTPVPQPLEYLVRDAARRHGSTRVGGATAYVRSEDVSVLEAILAERALAPALLRRIAPTVLVSLVDPLTIVKLLRDNGFAPVHEAPDGVVVVAERGARRARAPRERADDEGPAGSLEPSLATALVRALRAAPPRPAPGTPSAEVLETDPGEISRTIRLAVSDALALTIGYADAGGRTIRLVVRPTRIEGGRVYAVSASSDAEQVFLMHRITGAARVGGPAPG